MGHGERRGCSGHTEVRRDSERARQGEQGRGTGERGDGRPPVLLEERLRERQGLVELAPPAV